MSFPVLFLLILTLKVSVALSEGEETAIADLFKEWPFLGSVVPPWTSNASQACNAPFKGIKCSEGPDKHILSLYVIEFCQNGCGDVPRLELDYRHVSLTATIGMLAITVIFMQGTSLGRYLSQLEAYLGCKFCMSFSSFIVTSKHTHMSSLTILR